MTTGDENYLRDTNLYSLFEAQAICFPNKTAVVDSNGEYSYQHLYEKTQSLAQHLHQNGAKRNELVAVLCEKGLHQVISLLGIIISGAAYLPLDEDWPLGKLEEILKEGLVTQLIVTKKQLDKIKYTTIASQYIVIVLEEPQLYKKFVNIKAIPQAQLGDIAYVMFTSGSTGKPKGVVISHEGVLNTIKAVNVQFNINSQNSVLAVSRFSFDLSVYDIFGMLITGGAIIFPHDEKGKDPSHWYELIVKHKITIWNTVPQLMQLLIDYVVIENKKLDSLKYILLSGDWIPLTLPEKIKKYANNSIVMSLGGATEGSIWSIWYEIKNIDVAWKAIPYGVAMPNQNIYVLDARGISCATGVTGEIYISGKGVALGYWNDKEKTKTSFINHSILGRMFKTGDFGCWNKDGYVEFFGRRDQQVKLHGHRIELEEISSKICLYQNIREAVVLIKMFNGNAHLAAYYISTHNLNLKEIKKYLSHYLPYYMVPYYYIRVDAFPLTANGKLDREALLTIHISDTENYIAPINELEMKICRLWAESLSVDRIGIKDDFFQNGGNSILATKLAYKMSRELGLFIKPTLIFAHPNVKDFISAIQSCEENINIRKVYNNKAPLSFQQEILLNEELSNPEISSSPIMFELLEEANISILKKALIYIVKKHEILRTIYRQEEVGNWHQVVKDKELTIAEENVTDEALIDVFKDIYHENFDLTRNYPIKVVIYHMKGRSYLLIIIHNIALDGWSANVFMDDFEAAYLNCASGKTLQEIIPVELQYKDYAVWQRIHMSGNNLDILLQYWHSKLHDYKPFHFQEQKPRSAQISPAGKCVEFCLDEITSKNLRELANDCGTTLYTILLSALYVLVYQYTKQKDLAIVSFVANRSHQQIENLIGYFVNKIIFRTRIETQKSLLHLINNVHLNLIDSEIYHEAPFELIMRDLRLKEESDKRIFFPVMLNVHDFRSRFTNNLLQKYLKFVPVQNHYNTAKFDIGIYIDDGQKKIKGIVNYATCFYEEVFVGQLKENYVAMLNNFVMYKDVSVEQYCAVFP